MNRDHKIQSIEINFHWSQIAVLVIARPDALQ